MTADPGPSAAADSDVRSGVSSPPSFEHSELSNGIRVAIHRTKKLKTVLVKIFFTANLDEQVTFRSLAPLVLRRGTRKRPDMQQLARRREELYSSSVYSTISKFGEWHVNRFVLDVVNDEFLPGDESVLADGLQLLYDLIYDPLVERDGFREEYLVQEKDNLRLQIESIVDNKGAYAGVRCVEEMCRNEPFRLLDIGRIEDLPGIDAAGLLASHRHASSHAPMSIYVAGDVEPARMLDLLAATFDQKRGEPDGLRSIPANVEVGKVRDIEERFDVQQGKLVLGFRHDSRYGDESDEAMIIMNTVLGGGGNSQAKLFQNVREKNSMAYSAYSSIERLKGLAFISCGIEVEKYDRALELCLEQLEAVRAGEVSDDELSCARETILESSRMLEDNFSALAEADFTRSLVGQKLDLERFRSRIAAVGRDDIAAAAARLKHDTTYFLRN